MLNSLEREEDKNDWAVGGRASVANFQLEPSRLFPKPAAHHCSLRGWQVGPGDESNPKFVNHYITNQAEGENSLYHHH